TPISRATMPVTRRGLRWGAGARGGSAAALGSGGRAWMCSPPGGGTAGAAIGTSPSGRFVTTCMVPHLGHRTCSMAYLSLTRNDCPHLQLTRMGIGGTPDEENHENLVVHRSSMDGFRRTDL